MKPIILIFILFFIPNISFSQKSEVKVIEDLILEQKYFLADSILKEKILNRQDQISLNSQEKFVLIFYQNHNPLS